MIRGTNNSLKLYSICYTMNIVAKFSEDAGILPFFICMRIFR